MTAGALAEAIDRAGLSAEAWRRTAALAVSAEIILEGECDTASLVATAVRDTPLRGP